MSDSPAVPLVPDVPSAHGSTEHRQTQVVTAIGGLLTVIGPILGQLPQSNPWVSLATTVVGALTVLLVNLGYIKGRSAVKSAAASALPAIDSAG